MLTYFYIVLTFAMQLDAQKVFVVQLNEWTTLFKIFFGYPKKEVHASFSLELSETVFFDRNCGVKSNCPRYCNVESFAIMYCEPVCEYKFSTKYLACNPKNTLSEPNQYSLTDSKTFQLLNKTRWKSQTWFADLLSGKYFSDKLVFVAEELVQTTRNLEIEGAVMIDGTLLDQDLFIDASALIGFGPGKNNIVCQLYARNLIPFPIVHIALPNSFLRNGLLKIGDYGYETCVNWTQHATQHYNRWVLELQNIQLNGVQYERKVKALLTNHVNSISLPSNFVNELVKTNLLKRFNDTESVIFDSDFYFACDQTLELRMLIDDRLLTIPNHFLNRTRIDENRCLPLLDQTDLLRYNSDVEMIIGWTFMNQYCVSFDYNKMLIRIAEHVECKHSEC